MSLDEPDDAIAPVVDAAIDGAGDLLTGIPAPVRKNALKAFGRLCTAVVDIPVAMLEGVAAEKRAESSGRVKLIETSAAQIAAQMSVDPEYARTAVRKFGQRVIREQVNLDIISEKAAKEITEHPVPQLDGPPSEIDDDWLTQFEKEASQKSAADMQRLFARILAGEIARPSSFSVRTVRILGQLDKHTAALFKRFCSLSIALKIPGHNVNLDTRAPALGTNAASNGLQKYGLGFDALNILQENGLVIADYNSWMDYRPAVAQSGTVSVPLQFQGSQWALVNSTATVPSGPLQIHGVALTKAGKELFGITEIEPVPEYDAALRAFFSALGYSLSPVVAGEKT